MVDKSGFNIKASVPTQQDEATLSRGASARPSAGTSPTPTVSPSKPGGGKSGGKPPPHRTSLTFPQKLALKDFLSTHLIKRDPPDHLNRTHYYFSGFTDALVASKASEDLGFSVTEIIIRKMRSTLFGAVASDPANDAKNAKKRASRNNMQDDIGFPPLSAFKQQEIWDRLSTLENDYELLKTQVENILKGKH